MDEITFDNAPSGYPISRERIKFETELTKNAKSPKKALELPASDFSQKAILDYAKHHKMAAIKGPESWFLFDRRQISEPEVRKQIASGEYGHLLGYSDNYIPEQGQQVAISIDGNYSEDPEEIIGWRDSDNLGLTWKASDPKMAMATGFKHLGLEMPPEPEPEQPSSPEYPQVWLSRQTLPAKVYIEDTGKHETVEMPAIDVLQSYANDLLTIDGMLETLARG